MSQQEYREKPGFRGFVARKDASRRGHAWPDPRRSSGAARATHRHALLAEAELPAGVGWRDTRGRRGRSRQPGCSRRAAIVDSCFDQHSWIGRWVEAACYVPVIVCSGQGSSIRRRRSLVVQGLNVVLAVPAAALAVGVACGRGQRGRRRRAARGVSAGGRALLVITAREASRGGRALARNQGAPWRGHGPRGRGPASAVLGPRMMASQNRTGQNRTPPTLLVGIALWDSGKVERAGLGCIQRVGGRSRRMCIRAEHGPRSGQSRCRAARGARRMQRVLIGMECIRRACRSRLAGGRVQARKAAGVTHVEDGVAGPGHLLGLVCGLVIGRAAERTSGVSCTTLYTNASHIWAELRAAARSADLSGGLPQRGGPLLPAAPRSPGPSATQGVVTHWPSKFL